MHLKNQSKNKSQGNFTENNNLLATPAKVAIFIGYFVKKDDLENELTNNRTVNSKIIIKVYMIIIRYITPILLVVVFLNSLGIIKLK